MKQKHRKRLGVAVPLWSVPRQWVSFRCCLRSGRTPHPSEGNLRPERWSVTTARPSRFPSRPWRRTCATVTRWARARTFASSSFRAP